MLSLGMQPQIYKLETHMTTTANSLQLSRTGQFGHDGPINACCFSPNGKLCLTASMDTTCILWRADTLEPLHVFCCHEEGVTCCSFSYDGRTIVTCGSSSLPEVKVWDISKWGDGDYSESQTSLLCQRRKYSQALDAVFSPEISLNTLTTASHVNEFVYNDDWSKSRKQKISLKLPKLYEFINSEGIIDYREADDDPQKLKNLEAIDIVQLLNPASSVLPHNVSEEVQANQPSDPNEYCMLNFPPRAQVFLKS